MLFFCCLIFRFVLFSPFFRVSRYNVQLFVDDVSAISYFYLNLYLDSILCIHMKRTKTERIKNTHRQIYFIFGYSNLKIEFEETKQHTLWRMPTRSPHTQNQCTSSMARSSLKYALGFFFFFHFDLYMIKWLQLFFFPLFSYGG